MSASGEHHHHSPPPLTITPTAFVCSPRLECRTRALTVAHGSCCSCSALLIKTDDPRFQEIRRIKKPQARLHKLAEICKTVKTCHAPEDPDVEDEEHENTTDRWSRPIHGCGSRLPKNYTWDNTDAGGKLMVSWEATDDQVRLQLSLGSQSTLSGFPHVSRGTKASCCDCSGCGEARAEGAGGA